MRVRLHRALLALTALLASAAARTAPAPPSAGEPAPPSAGERATLPAGDERFLQVLFLGDRGHHRPAERADSVLAPLRARGIDLTYREDTACLAPETLARFDALVLYANHAEMSDAEETALCEWVEGGGGLVAVHCASACFPGSERFVALVGGQFASHGTGVFTTTRIAPEHPAIAGLAPLESWDETYVHRRHAPDKTVLATREGEPWTWVRTPGAGRVFYTAWGHDERTWERPAFLDLLERGIRWCAGDAALAMNRPEPFAEPVPAAGGVPSYRPDGHGAPVDTMPGPLSPEASLARAVAAPGLRLELFAAEPLVVNPIAIAWDERGRAFVAETVDYPNERGTGRDRIRVLEDTDGDGRADRATVFAEGLSIPTGLAHARGGLVVVQAPDTLFLRDTDGDLRADERRVLFSGWGTGDTHAGPSNLRYGLDNRLWGTVGYAGFRGARPADPPRFGQALWRMATDGTALEVVASTSNNTWGLGFTEEGLVVASTANGNPSVHAAIPQRHYEALAGFTPGALETIAESTRIHPITSGVRQVDFHGRFTAAAGHAVYTARAFSREHWNRSAFVCEPTGHLVARLELEPAGASLVARDRWNLVASDDEWTAPVAAEVGPDGAVWILDWYAYVVQHNPTPPGFETGPGNAYVTPLRDGERGRIWRLVAADGPAPPVTGARDLAGAPPAELVAALADPNLLWRLTAQRLIVERGEQVVVPALVELARSAELDALGLAPGALHALWTLQGLGALRDPEPAVEDALVAALRHPAGSVRRAALELLPRERWALEVLLSGGLVADLDLRVRLAALLALAEMPPSDAAGRAVLALLEEPESQADRWLVDAATCAAARHDAGFLAAVLARGALAGDERAGDDGAERSGDAASGSDAASARSGDDARASASLLANGDCAEDGDRAGEPAAWAPRTYSGRAEHGLAELEDGGRALAITSAEGADTSWFQEVAVEPGATYRLSARIRVAEGFDAGGSQGALLNVHELQSPPVRTEPVRDPTAGWTDVAVVFESGPHRRLSVNALFGGWGRARGTAWYADLRLERVAAPLGELLGEGPLGRVVTRVARHWAGRGPTESVVATVAALADAPPEQAELLLEGLVRGWPTDVAMELDAAGRAALGRTLEGLAPGPRARLVELARRWGARDAFAASTAEVIGELRATLADPARSAAARVEAARLLVRLADGAETTARVLAALDPGAGPELATGLVAALGGSRDPATGAALLARGDALAPLARRATVELCLRRARWTAALLDALEEGRVPRALVAPAQWTRLVEHPDPALAARARALRGGGAADDEGGAALVARFAAALEREDTPGDVERGRALFAEHCASCHALADPALGVPPLGTPPPSTRRGGAPPARVGPELTGIGERPTPELLTAILDPSRDVETNWQLWTVTTTGGLVLAGRLVAETRSALELLDADGTSHVLDRAELERVIPSELSLMPAGFESLGADGLRDLLHYLRAPR